MPLGSFKTALLGAAGVSAANNFIGWFDYNSDYYVSHTIPASHAIINGDGEIGLYASYLDTGATNQNAFVAMINEDKTVKWSKTMGAINASENYVDKGGMTWYPTNNDNLVFNLRGSASQSQWQTDTGYLHLRPWLLFQLDKGDGHKDAGRLAYKTNYDQNEGSVGTAGTYVWSAFRSTDAGNVAMQACSGSDLSSIYFEDIIGSPQGGGFWVDCAGGHSDYFAAGCVTWKTINVGWPFVTTYRPLIICNNGTNALNYQLLYDSGDTSAILYWGGITVDTSDNKYCALYDGNNTDPITILKVSGSTSTSMSIDWQQDYRGKVSDSKMQSYDIEIDSSGNSYTVGRVQATANSFTGYHAFIMKHNSSGTLQWSRMLDTVHSGSTLDDGVFESVDVAEDDESIVVSGKQRNSADTAHILIVARLAADGSGTGTYVTGGQAGTLDYYDGSSHIETATRTIAVASDTMNSQSNWINNDDTGCDANTVISAQTWTTEAV